MLHPQIRERLFGLLAQRQQFGLVPGDEFVHGSKAMKDARQFRLDGVEPGVRGTGYDPTGRNPQGGADGGCFFGHMDRSGYARTGTEPVSACARYHSTVSARPSSKPVEASKPKSSRALVVSSRRLGCPFGLEGSQPMRPS